MNFEIIEEPIRFHLHGISGVVESPTRLSTATDNTGPAITSRRGCHRSARWPNPT